MSDLEQRRGDPLREAADFVDVIDESLSVGWFPAVDGRIARVMVHGPDGQARAREWVERHGGHFERGEIFGGPGDWKASEVARVGAIEVVLYATRKVRVQEVMS